MPEKFLVGNKLVGSDKVKTIINPYTNKPGSEVYAANEDHFSESADYLTKAFNEYRNVPSYKKSELLASVTNKITKRKDELAHLITKETGKPIRFSKIEIDRAILTFSLGAEEAKRNNGEVIPLDLLKGSENKFGIIRRFPLGLILGITPWNFPINLVAHKVSPALASGNVIMLKPSSNSMHCGIEIGKIVLESCEENGLNFCPINVLTLGGSDIDKFVSDERIKIISFTGSSNIGWDIKKKAHKQKVGLELGGNAGVIVDEGIDINSVIPKIIIGGFSAAGQSCISVQRIYIQEKVYDEFRSSLIAEVKKINFGNPFEEDTVVGPMITEQEAIRAEKWIHEAEEGKATILTGGSRNGAIIEPTVIENASNELNVKCNEVFAPVITIEKFRKFEDAVGEVNNSRFGLQAGVFTNDISKVMFAFNNINTGGVIINDVSAYRMDSMPYGGVKDSGNSREGVAWAIKEMTEEKILVI